MVLALALGAFALIRPLLNITGLMDSIRPAGPAGPIVVTVLVSVVEIAAVDLSQRARALPTRLLAGLAHGVFTMVLGAVLSSILLGERQGPLPTRSLSFPCCS